MPDWSLLAKIGAIGAAPFTGGASLAALPAIGAIGQVAGGAAQGAANQRMAENQQALLQAQMRNQDALARAGLQSANANTRAGMQNTDNYNRAGLDLQRKQFLQSEPNAQARQALAGSLLSRIQPVQIAGMPAGMGVRSSIIDAIGPEAREAGSLLAQRGLSGLRNGPTQFDDLPPVSLPDILNLPPAQIAEMQKSGLLEKIMGGLGLGASMVGALGDLNSVNRASGNNLPIDPYGGG